MLGIANIVSKTPYASLFSDPKRLPV